MFTNYIQKKSPTTRVKRKHFISITHYLDNESYYKTQIVYRWSHQFVKRYENVDIYESDEYSWLIKGFENRNTIVKGIDVEYCQITNKEVKTVRKPEAFSISDEIYISLPEAHYTIDETDDEFFRMRTINYTYIGGVNWIQEQTRPALYINSIDTTARFDGNSILMYIDIDKAHKKFVSDIDRINSCFYENRKLQLGNFIGHLFSYTMMLYYINISHGWKFEDITYDKLWNLAMYMLSYIKPFEKDDWLKGVKLSYVKFLFERRAQNELSKGIKHFYRTLAQGKLIKKTTRYCFPKTMSTLDRELFKEEHEKPKTVHQEYLENRNQSIINDYKSGLSIRKLSSKYSLSVGCIHKIVA